jgi:hypothetical protein
MPILYPEQAGLEPSTRFAQYRHRMDSQRLVASFFAISFVFLSILLVVVDWAAASGRLRRNQWAGIRLSSTMRSDQAWVAGHSAALRLMPLHLLTGVALFIAVLFAPGVEGARIVGVVGAAVFLVVAVITGFVAHKAAKAVED